MKGYKILHKIDGKLVCKGYIYNENIINIYEGDVLVGSNGLHFSTDLQECFMYYSLDNAELWEIEANGIISDCLKNTFTRACSSLKLIRKLSTNEIIIKLKNLYDIENVLINDLDAKLNEKTIDHIINLNDECGFTNPVELYFRIGNKEKIKNNIKRPLQAIQWLNCFKEDVDIFYHNLKKSMYAIELFDMYPDRRDDILNDMNPLLYLEFVSKYPNYYSVVVGKFTVLKNIETFYSGIKLFDEMAAFNLKYCIINVLILWLEKYPNDIEMIKKVVYNLNLLKHDYGNFLKTYLN